VQLEINAEGVGAVGSRVLQLVTVLTLVTTAGTIDGRGGVVVRTGFCSPSPTSRYRSRWLLSGPRNSQDERRMRAAYVRASLCAPVSCPYVWGAYAWPVPAGHMRSRCWRLALSVRV
jgi:hypothetical protein